jgi:cytoskeletal protein RodZ
MEASTGVTGHAQDTRHPETAGRAARKWTARSKSVAAIAALGLAGFLSVTACTTTSPAAGPAATQPPPSIPSQSQPASTPQAQPASTPQAQPASTPQAQPASTPQSQPDVQANVQPGASPDEVAKDVAEVAVGNGPLTALAGDGVTATYADCDPTTISNPPGVSAPTSASCAITYSDGSVWQQTVTITYDSQGNPVASSTNAGIELSQPTN